MKKVTYRYLIVRWDLNGNSDILEEVYSDRVLFPEQLRTKCRSYSMPGLVISCEDDKQNPTWGIPAVGTVWEEDKEDFDFLGLGRKR